MQRDQDRRRWLTRTDAAKRAGISVAAIRRLEGSLLFPETIAGIDRFRPSEVAALPKSALSLFKPMSPKPEQPGRRTPGDEAADVFALFAEHKDLREIVTTLHVSPERVRTLYHHWLIDLKTGERLRQPKRPELPLAPSRRRVSASAVPKVSSALPPEGLDATPIASDNRPSDFIAPANAVTALVRNLLGRR
jgi:hypothetical protein